MKRHFILEFNWTAHRGSLWGSGVVFTFIPSLGIATRLVVRFMSSLNSPREMRPRQLQETKLGDRRS